MAGELWCETCEHLEHTSPTQVFWRCRWHCEQKSGEVTRCHVLPHTPACQHYLECERTVRLRGRAAMAYREIVHGVPAGVAMAAVGLVAS